METHYKGAHRRVTFELMLLGDQKLKPTLSRSQIRQNLLLYTLLFRTFYQKLKTICFEFYILIISSRVSSVGYLTWNLTLHLVGPNNKEHITYILPGTQDYL